MSGKKYNDCDENPLDVVLYNFAIKVTNPIFYKMKLTPNWLTSFGFIIGLISVYMLYIDKIYLSAGLWLLSYFFDCSDGAMARKYKMYSKFGKYYDQTVDIIKSFLLLLIFIIKTKNINVIVKIAAILTMFLITSYINDDCLKKKYNVDEPSNLCSSSKNIQISKMFGMGTLNIVIILLIIFYKNI